MAEKKEKRYVSDNAQLMAEWDWNKNSNLGFDPKEITHHSDKKVWWICRANRKWQKFVTSTGCHATPKRWFS